MLRQAVESYIALKRAVGFSFERAGDALRSFARFASERGEAHVITQTAIDWAGLASSVRERDIRLKYVIRFSQHARAEDPRHEIPPGDVYCYQRRRPVPFIFTPSEIQRLVKAASRLGPKGSLRPHTYSTLFALLASTGLRISEALALRLNDVTPDGLIIRETKFRKTRLVPLHETAVAGFERYLARRRRLRGRDDHVLVDQHAHGLQYLAVKRTFRALVQSADIDHGTGQPIPQLHSLRHTFAVRALESCPHRRDYVGRHLLALSTYLGHASVKSTYWYLEATPELMTDIAAAYDLFVKGEAT